jgi:hypothetical protein
MTSRPRHCSQGNHHHHQLETLHRNLSVNDFLQFLCIFVLWSNSLLLCDNDFKCSEVITSLKKINSLIIV